MVTVMGVPVVRLVASGIHCCYRPSVPVQVVLDGGAPIRDVRLVVPSRRDTSLHDSVGLTPRLQHLLHSDVMLVDVAAVAVGCVWNGN